MVTAKKPVRGYVMLTLEAYPEGRQFVSVCRELGVASAGDTLGEAIDAVREATLLYLSTIEELGERERVFNEKGIVIHKTKPREVHVDSTLPPNSFTGTVILPIAA